MNYQHSYHAGNTADVFKHSILTELLLYLQKKPTPICYMETHAGEAIYDLKSNPSQKTLEYEEGIKKIYLENFSKKNLDIIQQYLNIVKSINPTKHLDFYPGSGLIAKNLLRQDDQAILCELHPAVYEKLNDYFKRDKQMHVHHRDGYEALAALLPPKEKRGLVLIDPPFEVTDEFERILHTLSVMENRWATGVYAIWYPIKQYQTILTFYHALKKLSFKNIIAAELILHPEAQDNRLKGSGIVILNPPWQFDIFLDTLLPVLLQKLQIHNEGSTQLLWLKKDS